MKKIVLMVAVSSMCGIRITRCTGIDCTGISRKRNAGRFRENRGKGTSPGRAGCNRQVLRGQVR